VLETPARIFTMAQAAFNVPGTARF
jgi:hypothetical protein